MVFSLLQTIKRAFGKKPTYGPQEEEKREQWRQFRSEAKYDRELRTRNWFHHIFLSLFGGHRRKN